MSKKEEKPNVLLILADQHRQDCLSVYGNPDVISPNLEAIAGDGVVFDAHFCPYPVCTPSRYSLFSGKYPHEHLGLDNSCTLPGGIETFPRVLKREGYKTAAVGKMHFTPAYLNIGFDEMLLAEQNGPGRFEDDYHKYLKKLNLIDTVDLYDQCAECRERAPAEYWENFGALKSNLPQEHHSTTWITDRTLEIIDKWGNGNNLLVTGFIKPHHPFDPPGKYAEIYDKNTLAILPGYTPEIPEADKKRKYYFDYDNLDENTLRHVMSMYYSTITQIDDSVGKMVSLLRKKGIYENTMIIYTADHGDYMGFHHLLLKGGFMYDPLMKIPLVIKYPDNRRISKHSDLTCTTDLPEMIFTECGVKTPDSMKIKDNEGYVIAEYFTDSNEYMVRSQTHKLLINGSMENIMFFDIKNDPFELKDISGIPENETMINQFKEILFERFLFSPLTSHKNLNACTRPHRKYKTGEAEEMKRYIKERSSAEK
ncbi:MAG: sulfatase-like hydrolase/transferase [Oscillospiraceae bacterium]|nr:sulfatase-like hydrolase/transferase [Oscillospiraceae bacterium]